MIGRYAFDYKQQVAELLPAITLEDLEVFLEQVRAHESEVSVRLYKKGTSFVPGISLDTLRESYFRFNF